MFKEWKEWLIPCIPHIILMLKPVWDTHTETFELEFLYFVYLLAPLFWYFYGGFILHCMHLLLYMICFKRGPCLSWTDVHFDIAEKHCPNFLKLVSVIGIPGFVFLHRRFMAWGSERVYTGEMEFKMSILFRD